MIRYALLILLHLLPGFTGALSAQEKGVDPNEFVRIPPKSPEEERKHLHIKPGFTMELVASEPQVEDPVAMCFDERGNLFVAELHDHQHLPDPRTSKVKILSDKDGDGFFETSAVFADGLSWITGIACWDGGVYVGCSPDFIYLKDTDGDDRADVKKVALSGFDRTADGEVMASYHHERSFNNFNWGPDNRLYCASGMNGGHVRNLEQPEAAPIVLRKLDFSFDPLAREMRPETGSSQHGMAIDDWGNRYQTTNSNPALFPSYLLRYRLRNPGAALPTPMLSISRPTPKGPVFRRSRPEPWREARTRLRAAGIERGPVEQGGTVSGYFTGAADGAIYRGSIFPPEYHGSLFVGEVSENVIHHKEIRFPADRVEPDAVRPADESDFEFVASSDNWFRPVQIINGPGGALYVCDMYREVVEAWHAIPDYIQKHLDRDAGKDRGRIWRLVPENHKKSSEAPPFAEMNSAQLVDLLVSSQAWEQDTAARVLYQRQDKTAVPLLQKKLESPASISPAATLRVWYALRGMRELRLEDLFPGLESENPWVRIHAIRLLEVLRSEMTEFYIHPFLPLVEDPDPRVLYQLAFTLGDFHEQQKHDAFHRMAERFPDDDSLAKAIAASAGEEVLSGLLKKLLKDKDSTSAVVLAVCREAGRLGIRLPENYPGTEALPAETWIAVLTEYDRGLRANKSRLSAAMDKARIEELKSVCFDVLRDDSSSTVLQSQCLRFLPVLGAAESDLVADIIPLLSPGSPAELQTAATDVLRLVGRSSDTAGAIIDVFPSVDTHLRPSLIHLLAQRSTWRQPLLAAIRDGSAISALEVPAAAAAILRGDAAIAKEAVSLLPVPPNRDTVVVKFQSALGIQGDGVRGEMIFRERCLVCHQFGEEGGQVGPVMGEFQKHGKGQIMLNLLNPNKTVQPDYIGFVVTTDAGESLMGRIVEDTSESVVLRDVVGNDRRIVRENIQSIASTGRTLMPEGLETGMTHQDMADLLEFIVGHR